jgi:NADH-quinone oxidoreductase subunit G
MPLEVIMVRIEVDGKFYEAKPEKNLLETCLSLGLDIPHFCFHPALGSVGACRLCAVKKFRDKDDKKGRIVMSCMEPVTEGLIISIEDEEARTFRAAVIEGLMTNHPHDCPVCDEGGECHLQDMTVMTGHNYRRFDFPKRTYRDQNLGPFISHEMNRCIQCYRCVRFYRDYAGGKDLNVYGSRNHIYFGRHKDGTLENEFSGNLVEVCPTGVFTDKTLKKHFTRKWDLSNAPSICVHCSVGCNTIVSERYGSIRRMMSRYNGAVNGYFICDRGRFGYEFVSDEKRIRKAKIRLKKNDNPEEAETGLLYSILAESVSGNKKIIGVGSPRASLESNFALTRLVGKDNFYHGISKKEQTLTRTVLEFLQNTGIQNPSLKQIEKADAVFILGEDITNTAPMIALALRQAVRNLSNKEAVSKGIPLWNDAPVRELAQDSISPVYIASPNKDGLDDISQYSLRASYEDISNLGNAIASCLDEKSPMPKIRNEEHDKLAERIASSLKNAMNPLILTGINCNHEGTLQAALNVSLALKSSGTKVMLGIVLPECNSMGLGLLPGKSLDDLASFTDTEVIDTLVILENDLYRRAAGGSIDRLFERCRQVIVLDHLANKTSLRADVLLPVSTFAESEGTIVNNEGRAQRYYKALPQRDQVKDSWQWMSELIKIREEYSTDPWKRFDDVVASMVNEFPVFSKLAKYEPDAGFRMLNTKIPRQTLRYSGRTAMNANISVSEQKLPQDPDSPLAFSMEGLPQDPPSSLVPFYWTPGWNSVQAMYNYLDEPKGSMKGGDPGIRLIEPEEGGIYSYFMSSQKDIEAGTDELLIIPVYHIFGSEELSAAGSAISQRINGPFVFVNQNDADKIGVAPNDHIRLETSDSEFKIKVKIENSLPQGIAGLSVNLPDMQFIDLPCLGKLYKL